MSSTFRMVAMATAVAFLAATGAPAMAADDAKPVKKTASVKAAKKSQKARCDIYLCAAGSEPPSAGK